MNTLTLIDDRLQSVVSKAGLEPSSANSLIETFRPLFSQANVLCATAQNLAVTDATHVTEMKRARHLRLALRSVRIDADKARKILKEDSLRRGKAIDGIYNVLEYVVAPVEARLLEMEEFAERAEAARKARVKTTREELLRPYGVDPALYQLGEMSQEAFEQLLEGSRLAHEQRVEASRKAEEARLAIEKAEAEERERIRLENERLKSEAVERAAAALKEREQFEAQAEAERQKAAAARAEAEENVRKEREARAHAEAEAGRLRDAEEARKRLEASEKRRAAAAPDKDKLRFLATRLAQMEMPQMATEPGQESIKVISEKIKVVAQWIKSHAETLGQ